jgi:protein HokA
MPRPHKGSLLLVKNQQWRQRMPKKSLLCSLMVICITVLLSIWMVHDSLCELKFKHHNIELTVFLACDIKR